MLTILLEDFLGCFFFCLHTERRHWHGWSLSQPQRRHCLRQHPHIGITSDMSPDTHPMQTQFGEGTDTQRQYQARRLLLTVPVQLLALSPSLTSLILVHPVAGLGNTHHSCPSGWRLQNPSGYSYWCWDLHWLWSRGTHNPSLTPGAGIQFPHASPYLSSHASPWLWVLAVHTLTWHREWDYADTEWRKGLIRRCNKTGESGGQMQDSTRQAYWPVPIIMPSSCFIPFSVYASFVPPCSPFPCSLPHQLPPPTPTNPFQHPGH